MDYRCHHCDATLEAEPGRVGEWTECPACHGMTLLAVRPPAGDASEPGPKASGNEMLAAQVFGVLAILACAFGGLMLLFGLTSNEAGTMWAGVVALGSGLHCAFFWAVLHLLSRILGRLERRGESQ